MDEKSKMSLKIAVISFTLMSLFIIVSYFVNTNYVPAKDVETTGISTEVETVTDTILEGLDFEPIDSNANFVQNETESNANFVQEPIEDVMDFVTEDIENSTNFVIEGVQFDAVSSPNDIELTDDEIYRLAALVQAEADSIYECKTAIISLFLNRMYFYEEGFWETLNREGQFVTKWGTIPYAEPEEETLQAVYDVLENGITIPPYVMFYKVEGYHDWGDQVGWDIIGTTYFSYSQWQREEIECRLGG